MHRVSNGFSVVRIINEEGGSSFVDRVWNINGPQDQSRSIYDTASLPSHRLDYRLTKSGVQ